MAVRTRAQRPNGTRAHAVGGCRTTKSPLQPTRTPRPGPRSAARRSQGARQDYDAALRHISDFADAYVNRGVLSRKQGNLTDAIAAFETAIQLQPSLASAHAGLGRVRQRLGEWAESIRCFRRVVELERDSRVGKAAARWLAAWEAQLRAQEAAGKR